MGEGRLLVKLRRRDTCPFCGENTGLLRKALEKLSATIGHGFCRECPVRAFAPDSCAGQDTEDGCTQQRVAWALEEARKG